jgi:O-6-methylguanine DNA methyltransferase
MSFLQVPGGVLTLGFVESPIGRLAAGADDDGIRVLEFTRQGRVETHLAALGAALERPTVRGHHPLLTRLGNELEEYFEGRRKVFEVPFRFTGTEFQERVWKALLTIPYGKTRSYLDIAKTLGDPKAVRAVGAANGSNPISIIVPCHRVIGSNGSIVGYGGGLDRKVWLLAHERGERRLF